MSTRYEYIDTSHPFLSVTVGPDPAAEEVCLITDETPHDDGYYDCEDHEHGTPDSAPVLVIAYDEAVVVTGDLTRFAYAVQDAVFGLPATSDRGSLNERVFDALMASGNRLLADEFSQANGAS